MSTDDFLRHNYLKRVEAERRRKDAAGMMPSARIARAFGILLAEAHDARLRYRTRRRTESDAPR